MRKLGLTSVALAGLGLMALMLVMMANEKEVNRPIAQLVAEVGQPSYLATASSIRKHRTKYLSIQVPSLDPQSITNWHAISNLTAIWVLSEAGKREARFFYDDMKNDKSFDGGSWYSSRSPFGERLVIAQIDSVGVVRTEQKARVDAIATHVTGFAEKHLPGSPLQNTAEPGAAPNAAPTPR